VGRDDVRRCIVWRGELVELECRRIQKSHVVWFGLESSPSLISIVLVSYQRGRRSALSSLAGPSCSYILRFVFHVQKARHTGDVS
jgi:hypothetical protein